MVARLFGNDVAENFVTMATFCDGGPVLVEAAMRESQYYESVKAAKPDHEPKLFPFNNSATF